MAQALGILLAFGALLSWGFGDFFIQRSTRAVGVWKSLFFNTLFASLALLPFVIKDLGALSFNNFWLLGLLSIVVVFAALFDFAALKQGKIAIVEPLLGIELPITVGLSVTLLGEHLSAPQLLLIGVIFIGIVLAVTIHHTHLHYHKRIFEKGVLLAGLGAIGMALMNFLVGVSSNETSPLLTVWFFSLAVAIVCGFYLTATKEWPTLPGDLKRHFRIIAQQAIIDNLAWVFYAMATTFISIAITTAISESYIALTVLLGVIINRERLQRHQIIGVVFAIGGIITLAVTTQSLN